MKVGEKIPISAWKNLTSQNEEERRAVFANRNCGIAVLLGKTLLAIDCESIEVADELVGRVPALNATTTVRTSKGRHFYLRVSENIPQSEPANFFFTTPNEKGEQQLAFEYRTGQQICILPPSKHPSGRFYEWENTSQPIEMTDELKSAIDSFASGFSKRGKTEKEPARAFLPKIEGLEDVPRIESIIGIGGFRRFGDEISGINPFHGSSTGHNFSVNLQEQLWHCWRCESGGNGWTLLAVAEGLIDCSQAKPKALRGELFHKLKARALERGLVRTSSCEKRFYQFDGEKTRC